jgi:hypothetical protein
MANPVADASLYEDKARALELAYLKEAAGDYLSAVGHLRDAIDAEDNATAEAILRGLVAPVVGPAAEKFLTQAVDLGHQTALGVIKAHETPAATRNIHDDARAAQPALHPNTDILLQSAAAQTDAIDRAKKSLDLGESIEDSVVGVLNAANRLTTSATYALNDAANDASRDVAQAANVDIVWVAERDACVDCAAYSGQVVGSTEQFPGGLTFGEDALEADAFDGPPLHPNCRCHLEPSYSQDFAEALQREAQRSILRGIALPSESNTVRIRAAQKVLASNPNAPKSVIASAKASVKRGSFPPAPRARG